MTERGPLAPWPDPPPSTKPPLTTRVWTVLRHLHRAGWLRPRRIGCLLLVLLVLLLAVLWAASWAVNGAVAMFRDEPPVVAGSPMEPAVPQRPPGTGSPTIDRIDGRGLLIVAIGSAPALAERSPGSLDYRGFDVALLHLLTRDLGLDPGDIRFKPLSEGGRDRALDDSDADIALGGLQMAPGDGRTDFAGPYLVSRARLAAPAGSTVTGLDSLGDGNVCAPKDSPVATMLRDRVGERLTTAASAAACANLVGNRLNNLAGKPVTAVAADEITLRGLPAVEDGGLRMVGEPLGGVEYGIALPPGDDVFRERVNAVLRTAIEDGTWARLYEQYLGTPVPAPPAPPR